MINFHPFLTHFPIAGAFILPVLEVWIFLFRKKDKYYAEQLDKFRLLLVLIIFLTTSGSFFTGLIIENESKTESVEIISAIGSHYWYARIGFILSIAMVVLSWLKYKLKNESLVDRTYEIILVLFFGSVLTTGYKGGELVFKYAVGVQQSAFEYSQSDQEHR